MTVPYSFKVIADDDPDIWIELFVDERGRLLTMRPTESAETADDDWRLTPD